MFDIIIIQEALFCASVVYNAWHGSTVKSKESIQTRARNLKTHNEIWKLNAVSGSKANLPLALNKNSELTIKTLQTTKMGSVMSCPTL